MLTITGSAGTAVVTSTSTATIIEAASDRALRRGRVVDGDRRDRARPAQAAAGRHPGRRSPRGEDRRDLRGALEAPDRRARIDRAVDPRRDLAAAHTAVAAAAIAQAAAPPTADIASPAREAVVADVRKDAVTFSDAEEAFFRAGTEKPAAKIEHTGPVETFDDLDEGYQPSGSGIACAARRRSPD